MDTSTGMPIMQAQDDSKYIVSFCKNTACSEGDRQITLSLSWEAHTISPRRSEGRLRYTGRSIWIGCSVTLVRPSGITILGPPVSSLTDKTFRTVMSTLMSGNCAWKKCETNFVFVLTIQSCSCCLFHFPPYTMWYTSKETQKSSALLLLWTLCISFTYAMYSDASYDLRPPMRPWKCSLILQVVLS